MPITKLNDLDSAHRPSRIRSRLAVLSAAALLAALAPTVGPITADAATTNNDPNAIVEWNSIATSTLAANLVGAQDFVYSGFVQAAVYDAVIGIHRTYQPYSFTGQPDRPASAQAAAIAAAHEILATYVSTAQAALDASYAASLSVIRDGASKTHGIDYGIRVADHLIALRSMMGATVRPHSRSSRRRACGGQRRLRSLRCWCRGWAASPRW